jgi:hypothetical protein
VRPEVATAAAARLTALLARLGQLSFSITPRRTAIRVGISSIAVTPLPEPLLLVPGSYTFVLEANGYRSQELTVDLAAGQVVERKVALVSISALAPPPPSSAPLAVDHALPIAPPPGPPRLVIAGAVVAGALVVAGVGTGLVALQRESEHDDEPNAARRDDLADSGRRWALATDVIFGTAIAVAAGTAYLYFRDAGPSRSPAEARAQHRLHLVPWASADSAGIGVLGAL